MGHHTEEEAQVAGGAQVCDSLELVLSETVIVSLDRMRFTVDGTACDPGVPITQHSHTYMDDLRSTSKQQ